jgi:hypothetical protein
MRTHLAEMILDLRYRGPKDSLRKKHAFSEDIESVHAILFSSKYNKRKKRAVYTRWLEANQPCVFGRVAAKNKFVFLCLLEEDDILRMRRGDDDVRDTIQDHRQVWKRYALEGLSSSFVILLASKTLVDTEPGYGLKEVCRRVLELYMEVEPIPDDTIVPQREYVFLRRGPKILKFSTLPNVFCAQADGRWWHDHRTPGGVMTTSNALGHFAYARPGLDVLGEKEKLGHLENAMRTIGNAFPGPGGRKPRGLVHCPATWLVKMKEGELSPLRETSPFKGYSSDQYQGYFHTDHLIPSAFFSKERDPKDLKTFEGLSFRYIFDGTADPADHAELMAGVEAGWYEVRRNMDRLPDFADPERFGTMSDKIKGRLGQWLQNRLDERMGV